MVSHKIPHILEVYAENLMRTLKHGSLHEKLLVLAKCMRFDGFSQNAKRMIQRAIKRVPVLSVWCNRRQETFVDVGLFQTTTKYSSFLSLCLFMAFHNIFFL